MASVIVSVVTVRLWGRHLRGFQLTSQSGSCEASCGGKFT